MSIHTCDVTDTTAVVRYPRGDSHGDCGQIVANDQRADIDGLLHSPLSGELEAVIVTAARSQLVPVSEGGHRLAAELARVQQRLRANHPACLEVDLLHRNQRDNCWVVRTSSDTAAATGLSPIGADAVTVALPTTGVS